MRKKRNNFKKNLQILEQLVRQQLLLRYRRTFLGYLWSLVNPIMMMTVTAIVFSNLFHVDLRVYGVFLFAGMIPFNYFSNTVVLSSQAIINNEGLVKKIYFPRALLPLGIALAVLIDSLLTTFALLVLLMFAYADWSPYLLLLPICFILLAGFSIGIAFFVSVWTVYFRDLQQILGVVMQALIFASPVFYKGDFLSGVLEKFVAANPLSIYIRIFRAVLVDNEFPMVSDIIFGFGLSLIVFFAGYFYLRNNEGKMIYRL